MRSSSGWMSRPSSPVAPLSVGRSSEVGSADFAGDPERCCGRSGLTEALVARAEFLGSLGLQPKNPSFSWSLRTDFSFVSLLFLVRLLRLRPFCRSGCHLGLSDRVEDGRC